MKNKDNSHPQGKEDGIDVETANAENRYSSEEAKKGITQEGGNASADVTRQNDKSGSGTEKNKSLPQNKAVAIVMSCIKNLNDENFDAARKYVRDDMTFEGSLGARYGADVYFQDMKNLKIKYETIKVFADSGDVCLIYNFTLSGTTIFGCGLYHIEDNKITSIKSIFDPRPLLELMGRKHAIEKPE
jgi:hypothetical protein